MIHHVGYVVEDIEKFIKNTLFDYAFRTEIKEDPIQKAKICFLKDPISVSIELIQPISEDSPIYNFLKKGGGLHHICYTSSDLEYTKKKCLEKGALLVMDVVPAQALENKPILFIYTKNKELVEFVQTNEL